MLIAHFCQEADFPHLNTDTWAFGIGKKIAHFTSSLNTEQTTKLFLHRGRIGLAPDSFSAARPWEVRENVKAGS